VSERETLEVDILIVGAGPAGLSAAIRLAQLQKQSGSTFSVAVLEKGREAGAHTLSGAVLDLSALTDLIPDYAQRGAPVDCLATHDDVHLLTAHGSWRLPVTPPPLSNHGCAVISVNSFVKWLGTQAEAEGVDLFTGFGGAELLWDGERVAGVRTTDRGRDRNGEPASAFEPGVDVRAGVTLLCDGVRGNLTKTLIRRRELDRGRQPQVYALGIKELWETPVTRLAPGHIVHTMGYPLRWSESGGAFLYGLPGNQISLGLVMGLDYQDPLFDPHDAFQRLKQHPFVAPLLEEAELIKYGAKALPEGGWHTIPRLVTDGALIAGDAGGFVNSLRLKGIHLAMRTGMLAADAAFAAVRAGDVSAAGLSSYEEAVRTGDIRRELYPVRNVHQAFGHGLLAGVGFAGLSLATGGWWFRDPMPMSAGHERMEMLAAYYGAGGAEAARRKPASYDRRTTFDRVTGVHHSGTHHREDAPSHLLVHDTDICRTRCTQEYGNPCTRFCPAEVYEMVDDATSGKRLRINASNCVHCKTCDIMDPYQIIDWVPPEGGDGPQYDGM
jgi:electron-transferring-flavoprotein dehydrogenase